MTENAIRQRQQAPRKHGAIAFKDSGEDALEPPQRSRLQELKEQVQDREGVLELMQDRAANAVLMCEIVTSYIAKEYKSGIPLTQIPIINRLAAFQNSAQRALKDLIAVMPDRGNVLDAREVLQTIKGGEKD